MNFKRGLGFFRKGLGFENDQDTLLPHLVMITGFGLWIATVVLSSILADEKSGYTKDYYAAVAVLTGFTGVTTAIDLFFEQKWITMITITLGSIATFFSAGKIHLLYCKSNEI